MVPSARRLSGLALLVGCGSAVGTLLRAGIGATVPHGPGEWHWATFAINLVGSFVLGLLLEFLARTGPDTGWRRMVRVGVGTGVIGGFTTYSTFVVEIDWLGQSGQLILAVAYALGSIVLGLAAAGLGIAAAAPRGDRGAAAALPEALASPGGVDSAAPDRRRSRAGRPEQRFTEQKGRP